MPKLTTAEYTARRGADCPFCLGTDLSSDRNSIQFNNDRTSMTIRIECENCDAKWLYSFVLDGYLTPNHLKP